MARRFRLCSKRNLLSADCGAKLLALICFIVLGASAFHLLVIPSPSPSFTPTQNLKNFRETMLNQTLENISRFVKKYCHCCQEEQTNATKLRNDSVQITQEVLNHNRNASVHFKSNRNLIADKQNDKKENICRDFDKNMPAKQKHVVFLKVHKTGSTCVMNIFLRFALRHGLNAVLPDRESGPNFNYLGPVGEGISQSLILPPPPGEQYDILCNHMVYNKEGLEAIMPNDTKYVGIVRDPIVHFLSFLTYNSHIDRMRQNPVNYNKPLEELVHLYLENVVVAQRNRDVHGVRSRMAFDFGLHPSKMDDKNYINIFCDSLKHNFELVLVTEYFTESVVLLKRHMNWDLEDIIYIPINKQHRFQHDKNLFYESDLLFLQQWLVADVILYERFKNRLEEQIKSEGKLFQEELEFFKKVLTHVEKYCSDPQYKGGETQDLFSVLSKGKESVLVVEKTAWNHQFEIHKDYCKIMLLDELSLLRGLIRRAKRKLFF